VIERIERYAFRPGAPCGSDRRRIAIERVQRHAFGAAVVAARASAQRRLVDDLLALFGGRSQPVMTHLIEAGKLSLEDVQQAEKLVREMAQEKKP